MGAMTMPTFQTPKPISATVDVVMGDVRIIAGDAGETVVEVQPSDASNQEDVRAAGQTRVDYADEHLRVKAPKLRSWSVRSNGGSVDVTISLPAGSRLQGAGQLADFHADGRLGDSRIKTGLGRIRLDEVATVSLISGTGDISLERATGNAEVTSGSGEVRLREVGGSVVVKNSNGDTWVGEARGDVRVKAANGSIAVDLAHTTVAAKTATGDVRLGEVVRGAAVLETRTGDLEVGIREGTAAWIDVTSKVGKIHNGLDTTGAPEASAETVEVRGRTTIGDIVIRRP
jgi:DUF4097 and DUF4098 domain-containing protein YvlB